MRLTRQEQELSLRGIENIRLAVRKSVKKAQNHHESEDPVESSGHSELENRE